MKIHPIKRIKKINRWLRTPPDEPNSRGTTLLMWALVAGTSTFVVIDNQVSNDRQAKRLAEQVVDRSFDLCIQRVEGRADVRAVFIDLYGFVDEINPSSREATAELRIRLNELLPSLNRKDCGNDPTPPGMGG
jgi:hypothetical protein